MSKVWLKGDNKIKKILFYLISSAFNLFFLKFFATESLDAWAEAFISKRKRSTERMKKKIYVNKNKQRKNVSTRSRLVRWNHKGPLINNYQIKIKI